MDELVPLSLRFTCPFSGKQVYRTDGFVGAWSPNRPLSVECETHGPSRANWLAGANWFLCSTVATTPSGLRPKIHAGPGTDNGLAFRGYIVDPPLHHFSAPADLWRYWLRGGDKRPNGVFAAAIIEGHQTKDRRSRLTLRTDAFGFAPLYYRVCDELVLFATKPDLLATTNMEPDPVGIASVMANRYLVGDRTLFRDIHRCPAGSALHFDGDVTPRRNRWFSAHDLPEPERPQNREAIADVERAFTTAVRRRTALDYGAVQLPLSSGHDSRRLLGALLDDGRPFRSATVRIFEQGDRDLDAPFAAELARRFRFVHERIELPEPDAYARDDERRHIELCAETWMHHGWIASLTRSLPEPPSMVLDGFLGDVLSRPGYRLEGAQFFRDPGRDLEQIAEDVARTPMSRHVTPPFCAPAAIRDEVYEYLEPFSSRRNLAEFAYVLLRQRRATVLWSQQFMPPAHLATYPYADLDYIAAVAAIRPEDRCASPVQWSCLERFHPELAAVGGSRAIPHDAAPVGRAGNRRRNAACIRRLGRKMGSTKWRRALKQRLTPVGQALATTGWLAPAAATRWNWLLRAVFETLAHDREVRPVWTIEARADSRATRSRPTF